jgi:hypothetical protein
MPYRKKKGRGTAAAAAAAGSAAPKRSLPPAKRKPNQPQKQSSSILNDPRLIAIARQAIVAQPAQLHEFLVATTLHFLHRTDRIHAQRDSTRQLLEALDDEKDPSSLLLPPRSSCQWVVSSLDAAALPPEEFQNDPQCLANRQAWAAIVQRGQDELRNLQIQQNHRSVTLLSEGRLQWFIGKMQAIVHALFIAYPTSSSRHDRTAAAVVLPVPTWTKLDLDALAAATLQQYYQGLHPTVGLVTYLETTKDQLLHLHRQTNLLRADGTQKIIDPQLYYLLVGGGDMALLGAETTTVAVPKPDIAGSLSPLPAAAVVSSFNETVPTKKMEQQVFTQEESASVARMVQTVGTELAALTHALFVETIQAANEAHTTRQAERALAWHLQKQQQSLPPSCGSGGTADTVTLPAALNNNSNNTTPKKQGSKRRRGGKSQAERRRAVAVSLSAASNVNDNTTQKKQGTKRRRRRKSQSKKLSASTGSDQPNERPSKKNRCS